VNAGTIQVLEQMDAIEDAQRNDFGGMSGWSVDRLVVGQEAN
jgi:hypothetical protein